MKLLGRSGEESTVKFSKESTALITRSALSRF